MVSYALLKTLHVIGAVLMVGNVTVTGVWALLLYRMRDQVPFRPVAKVILWADVLTFGGGTLLTITGILMIRASGIPWLETPWILWGIGLLAASTFLWLVLLLPDQVRMERTDPRDSARLSFLFTRWSVVGWSATVVLYVAIWHMVAKG